MDVTIKPASRTNVPEIVGMMKDFYAIDDYPINEEHSHEILDEFIKDERIGGGIWLISSAENTIGYMILTEIFNFEYGGWIGFVDELYIKDAFRGQGIGKTAIDFIKEEAEKRGLKRLYLEVEPHNASAQKLYLEKDFKMHHRQLMIWKPKN